MADAPDLKEFVETALIDILSGISAAQLNRNFSENIAPAALASVEFKPETGVSTGPRLLCTTVKFDVQVVAETVSTAGGKGGLKIHIVSAELGASSSDKSQSTQRLQFAVPITFPGPKPGVS